MDEIADLARQELKRAGLNSRQVSVRHRPCGYSDELRFTIRDDSVSERKVNDVAMRFKHIRYDERAQEILEGCNTYVFVYRKWRDESGPAMPEDFKAAWGKMLENSRTEGRRGECTEYDGHFLNLGEDNEVGVFARNGLLPYHRGVRFWGDGKDAMRHVWFMIYNDRLDLEYLEGKKEAAE